MSKDRDVWIDRFYADIGIRVRNARTAAELSQAALADLVGLTRSSVANLEAGRQRIALHLFYMIAQALDTDPQELLPEPGRPSQLRDFPDLQEHLADSPESAQEFVRGAVARLHLGSGDTEDK